MQIAHDASCTTSSTGSSSSSGADFEEKHHVRVDDALVAYGASSGDESINRRTDESGMNGSISEDTSSRSTAPSSARTASLTSKMDPETVSAELDLALGSESTPKSSAVQHPMNPLGLHLLSDPHRGRGVFAPNLILAGTVIEESPVLVMSKQEWDEGKMDDTILGSYGFCWRNGGMAIGLGLGKSGCGLDPVSVFELVSRPPSEPASPSRDPCLGSRPASVPVHDGGLVSSPASASGSGSGSVSVSGESVLYVAASLFNHSSSPNVNFVRDYPNSTIRFTASRTIQPGEELCICYAADESKLWFIPTVKNPSKDDQDEAIPIPMPADELADLFTVEIDQDRQAKEKRRQERAQRLKDTEGDGLVRPKDWRKAKYRSKKKEAAQADQEVRQNGSGQAEVNGIISPRPVFPDLRSGLDAISSTDATSSRSSTPNYPAYPDIPARAVSSPALPAPLHSTKERSRHEHVGPVILTPELDWKEEDYNFNSREVSNGKSQDELSTGVVRIKGYTEREEDLERDDTGTSECSSHLPGPFLIAVDVWVVEVDDPRLTRAVLR